MIYKREESIKNGEHNFFHVFNDLAHFLSLIQTIFLALHLELKILEFLKRNSCKILFSFVCHSTLTKNVFHPNNPA